IYREIWSKDMMICHILFSEISTLLCILVAAHLHMFLMFKEMENNNAHLLLIKSLSKTFDFFLDMKRTVITPQGEKNCLERIVSEVSLYLKRPTSVEKNKKNFVKKYIWIYFVKIQS
ncbi:hypothetical protein ACJX0J_031517, partial [Zea mays]